MTESAEEFARRLRLRLAALVRTGTDAGLLMDQGEIEKATAEMVAARDESIRRERDRKWLDCMGRNPDNPDDQASPDDPDSICEITYDQFDDGRHAGLVEAEKVALECNNHVVANALRRLREGESSG